MKTNSKRHREASVIICKINNTPAIKMMKRYYQNQCPLKIQIDFNKIQTFVLYTINKKIEDDQQSGKNIWKHMCIVRKNIYAFLKFSKRADNSIKSFIKGLSTNFAKENV